MHPFSAAIEAHDHDAIAPLLAENVRFQSPVAFAPYGGRDLVAAIVCAADRVLEDLRYEREIVDGRDAALVFQARIGDQQVHACDFVRMNADGLIAELFVMVRPLSAANALAQAMAIEFEKLTRELGRAV
jgi:SnoaL-like domain